MRIARLLLTVVLAWGSGCARVESANLQTRGMKMFFHATKSGDGRTLIRVHGFDGDSIWSDPIRFSEGDELIGDSGGQSVRLGPGTGRFGGREAVLEVDAPSVAIVLHRPVGRAAPRTVIRFPEPFALQRVPPEASRARPLTIAWEPRSDDPMHVEARGGCVRAVSQDLPVDRGSFALRLEAISEDRSNESCDVSLEVRRSMTGIVDEAFMEGSAAFGHEVRHASFRSSP
jgi:hypothetical protein